MSYATLMVYVNADRVSKQLVSLAAGLADKFSAKLVGLSALAIMPPVAAEGVVILDNATEFDIAKMKARLAEAGNKFRAAAGADRQIEWRSALEFPTQTVIERSTMCRSDRWLKRANRTISIGRWIPVRLFWAQGVPSWWCRQP